LGAIRGLASAPPSGEIAPDNIGVFLTPPHFREIRDRLIAFIAGTNIYKMSGGEAGGALDVLEPYLLGPGSYPDPLDLGRPNLGSRRNFPLFAASSD
jgi:hypothetical protein